MTPAPAKSRVGVSEPTESSWNIGSADELLQALLGRKALFGFLASGLLFSFPGAILPSWGYHLTSDFAVIGRYFLAMNIGILVSVRIAYTLLPRKGISFLLTVASALGCAAFLFLAFVSPPSSEWWRMLGLLLMGASAGLLHTALFHAISPFYRHNPAATVNMAGILFGIGCLMTALLVSGAYYVFTVETILMLLAILPGVFAFIYSRASFPLEPVLEEPPLRKVLADFKNPAAVLFSLLLFFQFGNEWSIAGWLPLFLIRRIGISPETSLLMLALYWAALLIGRVAAQFVLSRISHGKLLMGSVLSALSGYAILSFTNDKFGAISGILLVGGGFAVIYPLVVEKIGSRFPYYHPGFYNGIFSFAFTGGLLAPWVLGYLAEYGGIRMVMVLPLFGTLMVFLLLLVITLEVRISGAAKRLVPLS